MVIPNKEEFLLFNDKAYRIGFSLFFAIIFMFLLIQSSFLIFFFNLINIPFNIIHELGHFFFLLLFLPDQSYYLEINPLKEVMFSSQITIEQLPVSIGSIIVKSAGSISIVIFTLIGFVVLRKRTDLSSEIGRKYLFFGLLGDIPNLFPIMPSILGLVNDGYAISIILLRMGYYTYPSTIISIIFSCLTFIFVLFSYYYLGKIIYTIIVSPKIKLENELIKLLESNRV
ncbi:MAG: hypothetical protein ACXAC8_07060 [Candidatus Hodarchaeales archaeon]|jgi:hypothetical protein